MFKISANLGSTFDLWHENNAVLKVLEIYSVRINKHTKFFTLESRIEREVGVVGVIQNFLKIQGAWNKWSWRM